MKSSQKKRVLILGQHYWPETFRITDIAEGLVERGYEVDVLCGTPNYPAGKFFDGYGWFKNNRQTKAGVHIYRVPEIPRGNNSNLRISINYLSFPFFAILALPWLLTRKYDRIIAYQLSPVFMSLPAIILSKLKRVPLYFYICDFWPHSLFSMITVKSPWLRDFITRVSYWHYRRADGAMGVFKGIQTRLVSEVGLPLEKTLYIPQAPEKVYENRMSNPVLEKRFKDSFNIVFAGNINPAQSFETVVAAARKVRESGIDDIRYIIIGEGMSKDWLIKEVKRQKLDDAFSFEGFKPVEVVPEYQMVADAMLVALSKSSLFEYGIPAKVYSYMPSGKPLLGAMDGEGKKLINNSGAGLCVDSGDAQGLAEAIIKLHSMNPAQRKAMGKRGFLYYKNHFERESNLTRLEEFVFNDNRLEDTE